MQYKLTTKRLLWESLKITTVLVLFLFVILKIEQKCYDWYNPPFPMSFVCPPVNFLAPIEFFFSIPLVILWEPILKLFGVGEDTLVAFFIVYFVSIFIITFVLLKAFRGKVN